MFSEQATQLEILNASHYRMEDLLTTNKGEVKHLLTKYKYLTERRSRKRMNRHKKKTKDQTKQTKNQQKERKKEVKREKTR